MALGYFAGWIRDVDNHHVAELNALVMDFALPASLFVATASTQRALFLAQWPVLAVFPPAGAAMTEPHPAQLICRCDRTRSLSRDGS